MTNGRCGRSPRRFGDHVVDDRLYPMWRLLLVTGLRCGDLEPLRGTLTVRRQLVVEDPGIQGAGFG